MEDDKRRVPRVPVEVWVQEVSEDRVVLHPAANLSTGGVFLYANRFGGDAENPVWLEFSLPGEQRIIRVRGRAAWRRGNEPPEGIGIEFVELRPADREAIEAWLRRTHPSSPTDTPS